MDYRERCYQSFVSAHWKYSHTFSQESYGLFAKVSRKRFEGILPADKSANIIDIGCGAGHFLYFLQNEGYTNTRGIDLSEEQLEMASKMGIKNFEKADLFDYLPKHSNNFDMIVANDIVEHLRKDEVLEFLDIIFHSLLPDGRVLISTVNAQCLFGAGIVFIDFTHEQGFTPASLSQVMRVCGFENVMVYGEKPIAHDFRSCIRVLLWSMSKKILKAYVTIEGGTGRGFWKGDKIFERKIFAVGRRLSG